MRSLQDFGATKLKGHLGDLGIDGWLLVVWNLKKQGSGTGLYSFDSG
jgi:hypothetical protein